MSEWPMRAPQPGEWLVWAPECGQTVDDADTSIGHGPAAVAADFAEHREWLLCDFSLMDGGEMTVCVAPRDKPDSAPLQFVVTGEVVKTYKATLAWTEGDASE